MSHCTASDLAHDKPIPSTVDTLVVGAGMAGLYSTWRILDHDPKASIAIFERSDRTGGRLDSDLVEIKEHGRENIVKEEEGGMRFTLFLMDNLMSLFLILGLDKEIVPFPMGPTPNNRLYFRGKSFDNTEAAQDQFAIWSELYNLAPSEQGINPPSFIDMAYRRILAVNPHFHNVKPEDRTPEFWQRFRLDCQWNGVTLKDWSLWNLFTDMGFSNEAITLSYGLAGFNGTFLSQMNAGEAFQLLEDFPSDPSFMTLANGYSSLPNTLVNAIGKEHFHLQTEVRSIDEKTAEGYTVTYRTAGKDGHPTSGTLTARKVILALPRQALETLFTRSNALNTLPEGKAEKLWNTLQTTTNQPLAKINLYYDYAWWSTDLSGQPTVSYGANYADLPLGTVYPFYSLDEANFAALEYENWLQAAGQPVPEDLKEKLSCITQRKFRRPAALTIYCDFLNINFWKALQENGPLFCSALQKEFTDRVPQTLFAASEAVVETATSFFKRLFNTELVPRPVLTSARIWEGSTLFDLPPSEQFGFGVHQWGLHADDRKAIPYLTEPLEGLYTCGEAFSDYQGWVEGALRSANLVLAQGFGLKPISTVYEDTHGICPSEAIQNRYAKHSAALIRRYIDPNFTEQQEGELAAAKAQRQHAYCRMTPSDVWAQKENATHGK